MSAIVGAFSVEDVQLAMAYLDEDEQAELHAHLSKLHRHWYSLPGAQSEGRYSKADVTGYGGAAGGGKTDLACGLALEDHENTTIFRNEISQLESVKERLEKIYGSRQGFNGQTNVWRLNWAGKRRRIRFGGFPNPGDEKRYQGNPNDLVVFDEAAEMREAAVRFVIGWNRSANRRQRTRVLLTFNPPTTPEGRWIIAYFAPWLDKHFVRPAKPGELRWVSTDPDGKDYWLDGPGRFVWLDGKPCYDFDPADYKPEEVVQPMSRTFIPARLKDNPYLAGGEYLARVQAFPEPLRSQMLNGDFEAGMKDDAWQVIPTDWVRQSMRRWKARGSLSADFRKGPMDSVGVDVAHGGRDKFVISRRHKNWFDELVRYPGKQITSGQKGAGAVVTHRSHNAPVHVDIIGWGAGTHTALVMNGVQAIGVNAANATPERSLGGQAFVNMRAQLVWRMREALDPEGDDPVDLPDDPQLEKDLTAYRWTMTRSGIQIQSKEDMKKRLGYSPDDGDAVCLANMATAKAETMLDALADVIESSRADPNDPFAIWEAS